MHKLAIVSLATVCERCVVELTHILKLLFCPSVNTLKVLTYVFVINMLDAIMFDRNPSKIIEYFKQAKVYDRAQKIAKLCKGSQWCQMVDTYVTINRTKYFLPLAATFFTVNIIVWITMKKIFAKDKDIWFKTKFEPLYFSFSDI